MVETAASFGICRWSPVAALGQDLTSGLSICLEDVLIIDKKESVVAERTGHEFHFVLTPLLLPSFSLDFQDRSRSVAQPVCTFPLLRIHHVA